MIDCACFVSTLDLSMSHKMSDGVRSAILECFCITIQVTPFLFKQMKYEFGSHTLSSSLYMHVI